jgi:hypothetical protein
MDVCVRGMLAFVHKYLLQDAGLDHVAIALLWSVLALKIPAAAIFCKLH